MANILLIDATGAVYKRKYVAMCYYEGLIKGLTESGNNVMHIMTPDFNFRPFHGENQAVSEFQKKKLFEQIKKFQPDLILSFNHASIQGLDKLVDCPFIVWEADSTAFFLARDYLKANSERFHFVAISSATAEDFKNVFSANSKRIIKIQPATAIINQREEKRYNISFIGQPFIIEPNIRKFIRENPYIRDLSDDEIDKLAQTHNVEPALLVKFYRTGFNRAAIICALAEYGIKLFGPKGWEKFEVISENLMHAYDPRCVYSLTHNQLIYNRSKISLNINHVQAKSGYSWRVADIMASSSVLLSSYSSDLAKSFPKIKFPFYHSASEAAELAKKLLADAPWRKDLMLACNDAIEKNGRWSDCLKQISDFTGVRLTEAKMQGSYQRAIPEASFVDSGVDYVIRQTFSMQAWRPQNSLKNFFIKIFKPKINTRFSHNETVTAQATTINKPPIIKAIGIRFYHKIHHYYWKNHAFNHRFKRDKLYD